MIKREIFDAVLRRLAQFDSMALVGPRQVGKTTLAREVAEEIGAKARYLDLESPLDRRLLDDPDAYFTSYADHLIILDEVQRIPAPFGSDLSNSLFQISGPAISLYGFRLIKMRIDGPIRCY